MADAPDVDGRRRAEIRQHIEEIAPYYTGEWDPEAGGVGSGLVDIFAEMAEGVTERLDSAPGKHRVAFYDALGFGARPPQAARVPVQIRLASGAPRNVAVRPGTEAIAETDGEVTFRIEEGAAFEATPARLTRVVAVHPDEDAVYDHSAAVDGGGEETLLAGENAQEHAWYVGDADLLTVGTDATVSITVETGATPEVLTGLEWAYYGEGPPESDAAGGEGGDGTDEGEDPEPVEEWHELGEAVTATREGEAVTVELHPEGPLVETAVDGTESKWVRATLPADSQPTGENAFQVEDVRVGPAPEPLTPDMLLANDVPLATDPGEGASVRPFGETPRGSDVFYLACTEAFTKRDAEVTVTFSGAGSGAGTDPSINWEYWNGNGWSRIDVSKDGTDGFLESGDLEFAVPEDFGPTTVSGHEGHWIRARLVGGGYGEEGFVPRDEQGNRTSPEDAVEWERKDLSPPEFDGITLTYTMGGERPSQVHLHNNLATEQIDPAGEFGPFRPLPEETQTLYLGFDRALSGGPIQLFVSATDRAYPEGFTPRIRYERVDDPAADVWTRVTAEDGTASLTEEGILGLTVPEGTLPSRRFGSEHHWIRARVRGDAFVPPSGNDEGNDEAGDDQQIGDGEQSTDSRDGSGSSDGGEQACDGTQTTDGTGSDREPCGETVATEPPTGGTTREPPTVEGLYTNTGWARNVEAVEGELLGGSDGERGQTFAAENPPVLAPEVWVDELTALSLPQREALAARRPGDVREETDAEGTVSAFWVRWERVDDFFDSEGGDRHYVLEAADGRIRFGDGTRGKIPPRGTDNVRTSYETGGGPSGNVPAGSVAELKSGLPFVEAVTNPAAGTGGTPAESTEAVLDRAPRALRDRGRAVTPPDFERLAADASRRIARTRCIPGMDRDGEHAPGRVTVLVVPDDPVDKPAPATGLIERVESSLADHAHAGLLARERLTVRGPSYVGVRVDTEVIADDAGSLGSVEDRIEGALDSYLHPLDGDGGEGWDFGDLPNRSDLYALLEGIEGVDHVASLVVQFSGAETVAVGEGEPPPTVSPDALVHGDTHDVTVRLRERERGREGGS